MIPTTFDGLRLRLDQALRDLGLSPTPVGDGVSYRLGRRTLCRVDPKPKKGCLRVWVGEAAEAQAPAALRGHYRQKGWLILWPADQEMGVAYVSVRGSHRGALKRPFAS